MLNPYGFYQSEKQLTEEELRLVSTRMHKKIVDCGADRDNIHQDYYIFYMGGTRTIKQLKILREAGLVRKITRK